MKISLVSAGDDDARVAVSGRIVQREINPVHDPIVDLLGANAYSKKLVMDLAEAEYVDSSGIGWLLGCHKRFRQHGGKLILQSLRPVVSNVMRVLRLNTVFEFESEPEATTSAAKESTP